ncbi:MAG: hypothetical protein P1V97_09425 [Planctomycetota bacterium]|nr:hypothetical protein [Planctomycetota bacterium]
MSFDRDYQRGARRGSSDPEDPLARRRFMSTLQRRYQKEPEPGQRIFYVVCLTDVKKGVSLTYALESAHENPNPTEKQPKFASVESAVGFAESVVQNFPTVKCWVIEKGGHPEKTVQLVHAGGSLFFE